MCSSGTLLGGLVFQDHCKKQIKTYMSISGLSVIIALLSWFWDQLRFIFAYLGPHNGDQHVFFQNLIQLLIRCVTNLGLAWGPKQSSRVIKIGSNREHQIWSIIAKVLGQVRIWLGMYTEQVMPDLTLDMCTFTQQHVCT